MTDVVIVEIEELEVLLEEAPEELLFFVADEDDSDLCDGECSECPLFEDCEIEEEG